MAALQQSHSTHIQTSIGDDRVHFDPIRAVQSIKLSNNYRTAKSNDNFLSTVVLNTYFFNNAVIHHDDIKQSPPKFPYEADYSSSSDDDSSSTSTDNSSSSYETESDDNNSSDSDPPLINNATYDGKLSSSSSSLPRKSQTPGHKVSASQSTILNINHLAHHDGIYINTQGVRPSSAKTPGFVRAISSRTGFKKKKLHKNNINMNRVAPMMMMMQPSSSTPSTKKKKKSLHKHHHTATNLYYVPSKIRHQANPTKASKILGINSDAVILSNHQQHPQQNDNNIKSKKKIQHRHRKSNSFSDTFKSPLISNTLSNNNGNTKNNILSKDDMKMNVDDDGDDVNDDIDMKIEEDDDEDDDYYDDEELTDVKLRFDKFKPQKRNTGKHLARSQTVDFTNTKIAKELADVSHNNMIIINDEHNNILSIDSKPSKRKRDGHHTPHHSMGNINADLVLNQKKPISRRHRLSISGKGGGVESSDVIEICLRIDKTKKGYMFIGIIPANKINNVVQPGFMFGFNEYTYALHGYSGKTYHDKIPGEYYFAACNTNNSKRKNDNNNNSSNNTANRPGHIARANTVDITSGISGVGLVSATNRHNNNMENDRKENNEFINNFTVPTTTATVTSTSSNDNTETNSSNKKSNNNGNGANKKLPILHTGDIVTVKLKLNRNSGKFTVIYNINGMDYGNAWKTIDPPVTVGITMVGRSEQISLLSCTYKPYKNDKSCVIL